MPINLADTAISVTNLVGRAAALGESALPAVQFFAGFFPGAAPAVQAIAMALPIIRKISAAAPVVAKTIEAGKPIFSAIQEAGPDVLPYLRELYAIAVNSDPDRPETTMRAVDVDDQDVLKFAAVVFTPGWTNEETQAWWDRAQGQA